ncbi:hypothetical protein D9M72_476160 [compost metagenome]
MPLMVAPLTSVALMPVTSWPAAISMAFAVLKDDALLYHCVSAPLWYPSNFSL